jgi:hypothetical protein
VRSKALAAAFSDALFWVTQKQRIGQINPVEIDTYELFFRRAEWCSFATVWRKIYRPGA